MTISTNINYNKEINDYVNLTMVVGLTLGFLGGVGLSLVIWLTFR